jgi:hypothetical protein
MPFGFLTIQSSASDQRQPAQVAVYGVAEGRRRNPLLMATGWPLVLVAVFLPACPYRAGNGCG